MKKEKKRLLKSIKNKMNMKRKQLKDFAVTFAK